MKERPIIFSAPMVRAILDGRKTQTRRVVKGVRMFSAEHDARWNPHVIRPGGACPDSWSWWEGPAHGPSMYHEAACPYGRPGDRLWVRETFSGPHCFEAGAGCGKAATPPSKWGRSSRIWYWADGNPLRGDWTRPRPSIHMPRWASRITLEVTGVRVERLQDISANDAVAEGVMDWATGPTSPQRDYRALWESINGPGSWNANPWVWVVEFKRAAQAQAKEGEE